MTTQPTPPTPEQEAAVRAAAVAAAEAHLRPGAGRMERITLETGIVLRLKPVPPSAMHAASSRVPIPQVPLHHNEARGIDEPNPNDPRYLMALAQWQFDSTQAALTVALMLGTEVEHVPDGKYRPEDDAWLEELRAVYEVVGATDVVVHATPERARYLDWVRLYAIGSEVDTFRLTRALMSAAAPTESEVEAAAASFRDQVRGVAAVRDAVAAPPRDRDLPPAADTGDGEPVRGA